MKTNSFLSPPCLSLLLLLFFFFFSFLLVDDDDDDNIGVRLGSPIQEEGDFVERESRKNRKRR